jgi:hypothetical protein
VAVATPQPAAPTNGAAVPNGAAGAVEAGASGEAEAASTAVTSAPSEHADLYADTDAVASLSKEDVEALLQSRGQDATLLVLYAPWCRFCQVRPAADKGGPGRARHTTQLGRGDRWEHV